MREAAAVRDAGHSVVTFSPKVFIPLTRLCRDSCGYCTFAQPPRPGRRAYMTLDEVLQTARLGQQQGCTEALFTLGDKPELLYQEAHDELAALGYSRTLDYVYAAAKAVFEETGLLPHVNAGVMGLDDVLRLKEVSTSQGLMLESTSLRLLQPGGAHYGCPDKDPALRLATIEAAGQAGVPFTSGLLIGIGESREERLQSLAALAALHRQYGHIQELIIQNFRAKPGTAMASAPEPPLEELLWTIAAARIMMGPDMNIQAPPNLTPLETGAGAAAVAGGAAGDAAAVEPSLRDSWLQLLAAGINDWGGISPITRDFVNPEKAWPHLSALAEATASTGMQLLPRLPLYPRYGLDLSGRWLDHAAGARSIGAATLRLMDSEGYVRGSEWCPGQAESTDPEHADRAACEDPQSHHAPSAATSSAAAAAAGASPYICALEPHHIARLDEGLEPRSSVPPVRPSRRRLWRVSMSPDGCMEGFARPAAAGARVRALLESVLHGDHQLNSIEIELLLRARGADYDAVCAAADALRRRMNGDTVTYVVNRNINYTNVCTYKCAFCAFSKGKAAEELRGAPYVVPLEEISRRAAEAWGRGATEVCMQGGIHPDFDGHTYLRILGAAKDGAPGIHVHAFSPLEVQQGAATLGLPLRTYLSMLRDAGLGSLPGTAAEVLHDGVRSVLCPDKLTAAQWLEVVEAAHSVGLRTTSTIMFGHVDNPATWATHLVALRELQQRSGGITEFVPLPFVHMEAPMYLKGRARRGPTLRECVLLHAISRLALHPHISNIQASWVKMGPARAAQLLSAGCNDMGGSIMNESITKAAGASHGQELVPERMEALIREAGRHPVQRTTLYGIPPASQTERSFRVEELAPLRTAAPFAVKL